MKRNKLSAILKKRMMEIYKNVPKLSTIERIAKALGVSPICVYFPFFYHRVHSNQRFASFTEERKFSYNNLRVTPSNFSCRPPWFYILKYTHIGNITLIKRRVNFFNRKQRQICRSFLFLSLKSIRYFIKRKN